MSSPNSLAMISQTATQKQQARILPQQIRLLNLFHLTTMELGQRISQELEENPLLEEVGEEQDTDANTEGPQDFSDWEEYGYDDLPDYKTEYANFFPDQQIPEKPIAQGPNFREQLKTQLRLSLTDEGSAVLAHFLVDSLNDDGMLEQDLSVLAEDYSFRFNKWVEPRELETVLQIIQQLDPPGLGARNTRECLLLQLQRKDPRDPAIQCAIKILSVHYDALQHAQWEKIREAMNIPDTQFRKVLDVIAALPLRPAFEEAPVPEASQQVVPDFIITWEDEGIRISLARQRTLRVNRGWLDDMKRRCRDNDKAAGIYLRSKLQSAEWFISSLQQREASMLAIMQAIVDHQQGYFQKGDALWLRPMILKQIAEATGLDISTVSRICSHKYAATPFGNILLKDLFTEGLDTDAGEPVSGRVVKETLRTVVETEDPAQPYTDHQLMDILKAKGIRIARRTIAKYRGVLQIPAAKLRALWTKQTPKLNPDAKRPDH